MGIDAARLVSPVLWVWIESSGAVPEERRQMADEMDVLQAAETPIAACSCGRVWFWKGELKCPSCGSEDFDVEDCGVNGDISVRPVQQPPETGPAK